MPQSLKKTLRCRFMLFGIDVHSYEQNAVNLPGSLAWLASSTSRFHTVPAISGDIERLDRRPGDQRLDGVQRHPLHLFLGPRLR